MMPVSATRATFPTTLGLALIALAPFAQAKEAIPSTGDFLTTIKFSGDLRARYEFRESDPADPSHALTARARIGMTLGPADGFSAFVEGEGTQAIVDDFRSNPSPSHSTQPYKTGHTVIADPNNVELNQAYLNYANNGFSLIAGRQRIVRNNGAFIWNCVWRQNEQTFDAISLGYANENDFSVSYVYSDRVQRIFGADAHDAKDPSDPPPLRDFEGDFHLFDISRETDLGKIGGYAYLLDVDNNNSVGKSNSFGAFWQSECFYLEGAFQDGKTKKGLPGGLVFKGFLHYFMDGKMENDCGYEADAVLVKKFNNDLTGVFKAAYFSGEDFYQDIKQVSLQLDYKF